MVYTLQRDGEIQFSKPVRMLSLIATNNDINAGSIVHTITINQSEAESGIITKVDAGETTQIVLSNLNGSPLSQMIFNDMLITSISYTTNTDAITSAIIVEIQSTSRF